MLGSFSLNINDPRLLFCSQYLIPQFLVSFDVKLLGVMLLVSALATAVSVPLPRVYRVVTLREKTEGPWRQPDLSCSLGLSW